MVMTTKQGVQIMKRVGIVGIGDMGIGMAGNIINRGYSLTGFDIRDDRKRRITQLGGAVASTPREVAEQSDVIFVMVLNGDQVQQVVTGPNGLLEGAAKGSVIIVTATIKPAQIHAVEDAVRSKGVELIDAPVSGGKSGADNGTLTIMAAGSVEAIRAQKELLSAISKRIFHVGSKIGDGQTVKAALQALIGTTFAAIFESLVLGVKAGISAEILYDVFSNSAVASPLFANCAQLIMDRKFKGTGSHIGTMYKDISISMEMARESGVPMFTAASAHQLFQAGISMFPDEDNWSIVKILEQFAGAEVRRGGAQPKGGDR